MRNSVAIGAIAEYVRSVTLRQPSHEDARAELSALTGAWTGLRARVVSSREEYDSSRHFDVLLSDADGTYTVSFAPPDGLPWPLRGVHRWNEGDLLRVNGTILRIQQAIASLDFVWERDDLLDHLVNVCLIDEELDSRVPSAVSDADLQVRLDEFRRARGLLSVADTHEWLAQQGVSHRQLERRLADALLVEILAEQVVGDAVADFLKADKSKLGIFPVMLASAGSQADLQELRHRTADPASWHTWAVATGGNRREVRSYRIDAFDAAPSLTVLASDDVPVGTVSEVFPYRDAHALACKVGTTELPEPHAGDIREPLRALIDVTGGDKKYHTLPAEPPRHEMKRLYRGMIQPMRIINRRQQRCFLRGHRKQVKQRDADCEFVTDRRRTLLQRQRDPQRVPLRPRQARDEVGEVSYQLSQSAAGQIDLGLHATGPEHRHPSGLIDCVVQEGGLAHPRLAFNRQRRTSSASSRREQLNELTALTIAPDQRGRVHHDGAPRPQPFAGQTMRRSRRGSGMLLTQGQSEIIIDLLAATTVLLPRPRLMM